MPKLSLLLVLLNLEPLQHVKMASFTIFRKLLVRARERAWVQRLNTKVAKSPAGRWFRLDGSGHKKSRAGSNFTTELRAGLATFFAMAYIIAVNASIVADTGGTCVCNGGADDPTCANNDEYSLCLNEIKRDLITATAAISALASFCMGLFANL